MSSLSELRLRQEYLERELSTLREKRNAVLELAKEEARLFAELKETDALLRQVSDSQESILDRIRIASPCTAEWAKMIGDDRVRHCGECKKNVYDLSAMTRDEAEELIVEKDGDLCVTLAKRHDGTVVTTDCPVGAKKKRVKLAVFSTAGAAAVGVGLVFGANRAYAVTQVSSADPPCGVVAKSPEESLASDYETDGPGHAPVGSEFPRHNQDVLKQLDGIRHGGAVSLSEKDMQEARGRVEQRKLEQQKPIARGRK